MQNDYKELYQEMQKYGTKGACDVECDVVMSSYRRRRTTSVWLIALMCMLFAGIYRGIRRGIQNGVMTEQLGR